MKLVFLLLLLAPGVAYAQSPGGVSGPSMWVRSDNGAYRDQGNTAATDGDGVAQWNDQSSGNRHLSQILQLPVFLNGTTAPFNYNPVIAFTKNYMKTDGVDGLFQKDVTYNDIHIFSVHQQLNTANAFFIL